MSPCSCGYFVIPTVRHDKVKVKLKLANGWNAIPKSSIRSSNTQHRNVLVVNVSAETLSSAEMTRSRLIVLVL
ncbi:hypothetical protein Bpfe_027101, partial [Biomphalaria pfeifferi]